MRRASIFGGLALGAFLVAFAGADDGMPSAGKAAFEHRCGGCHALDHDKEGPRLGSVYGRAAASNSSFPYSDALRRSGLTWNGETLDRWLADSEKLVPGTDMTMRVLNADERAAIIAYLKQAAH
jgi:cytochrome c